MKAKNEDTLEKLLEKLLELKGKNKSLIAEQDDKCDHMLSNINTERKTFGINAILIEQLKYKLADDVNFDGYCHLTGLWQHFECVYYSYVSMLFNHKVSVSNVDKSKEVALKKISELAEFIEEIYELGMKQRKNHDESDEDEDNG